MSTRICGVNECDAPHYSLGWCRSHYRRAKLYGDPLGELAPEPPDPCKVDDCDAGAEAQGMCNKHYKRWRKHGDVDHERRTRPVCIVEECTSSHRSRGYCDAHLKRFLRHGDPLLIVREVTEGCSIPSCTRPHKAYGWCKTHYARWQRHGDALGPVAKYPDLPDEIWKPVLGYEGLYLVSNLGRVRGLFTSRVRKQVKNQAGYQTVSLKKKDDHHVRAVHRLVLEAFVGPRPPGLQCRHGPGGMLDNRLENLCWGTPKENTQDKYRDGTILRGAANPVSKLTEEAVRELRQRYVPGEVTMKSLAAEFGVTPSAVWSVVHRRSWKQVA